MVLRMPTWPHEVMTTRPRSFRHILVRRPPWRALSLAALHLPPGLPGLGQEFRQRAGVNSGAVDFCGELGLGLLQAFAEISAFEDGLDVHHPAVGWPLRGRQRAIVLVLLCHRDRGRRRRRDVDAEYAELAEQVSLRERKAT